MLTLLRRRIVPLGLITSLVCALALLASGSSTLIAQTAQPPDATGRPAPPPMPPDAKAYTDATRITDPAKKMEALEKFIKDFPDSPRKATAQGTLFDTMVKERPDDKAKILELAQGLIDSAPDGFKASAYSRIASRMVENNVMLEEAEKFATEGLKVFDIDEQKRMQRSRATHLATIGRIRIKQGRMADAETALKDAYAANPEIPSAAIGLAELAETKGDNKAAIDYWMTAALTGRISAEDRLRFETLYKKAHGSLDNLDAELDAKYKATFPAPVHAEAYKPSAKRSDRVVLAEVFTGAACPPCVAVDLGFDAALERYARKDVAVLMYHVHIPGPDPLTTKATDDRRNWYRVTGVPNFAVDGELDNRGGGGREQAKSAYERIIAKLDKALEMPAEGALDLSATLESGTVRVKATPSRLNAEGKPVKLQIALVEEMISYSGENGIRFHPVVVRALADADKGGITVERANPTAAEYTFDLAKLSADHKAYLDDYEAKNNRTFSRKPTQIDPGKLSIVAFLQDEATKKVLQAAHVKVGGATTNNMAAR